MKGIIGVNERKQPIFGNFSESCTNIQIYRKDSDESTIAKDYDCVKDIVFFSVCRGCYYFKDEFTPQEIKHHVLKKTPGLYPYDFAQVYEAVNHFDIFNGKQQCISSNKYLGAGSLKYTFGIEYETSLGCVPEDFCFRDGLIPLRDGSISAPEYSTVVLSGNQGVNMIHQQLETLRKYTAFNKECSLHMHLGGFPVNKDVIFTLYSLCFLLEVQFQRLTNRWVFNTAKYKKTGKNYCLNLEQYTSFEQMYTAMTGAIFEGSLTQPHPNDREHAHKWQINARYRDVNFINMICYDSPKTVEFRFLRPTYNFTKIYTWLLIFNAILAYAENIYKVHGPQTIESLLELMHNKRVAKTIPQIVDEIYNPRTREVLRECISGLSTVKYLQDSNGDFAGSDTSFEDKILTESYIVNG